MTHGEDANITGSGVYHGHRKYCGTGLQLASEQGHDHIVAAMVLSLPKVLDVNYVREVFMICMRRQCWLYCWCQSLCHVSLPVPMKTQAWMITVLDLIRACLLIC